MHVAPDDAVHAPGGAEGVGILGREVPGQVLVAERLLELLLLAQLQSHDAEGVDHRLVHPPREAVLGGLGGGEVELRHQAGHVEVRDQLAVEGEFDLAPAVVGEGHVEDGIPDVAPPGRDAAHQLVPAPVRLLGALRDRLAEVGQPAVGGLDGLDEVPDRGERGGLLGQALRLVQVALGVVEQAGEKLLRGGVVAAHELGLGRLLEDPEGSLVGLLVPAPIGEHLERQVEVLVGGLGGQRVEGLVAGVVVEVGEEVGIPRLRLLVRAQVEMGDDGEQVVQRLRVSPSRDRGHQVAADLAMDLAAPGRGNRGEDRFLDPVVDELELVLVLHQEPLPQRRLQHLEGPQKGDPPDGRDIGRGEGVPHAGAVLQHGDQLGGKSPDLRAEQRHHRVGHPGLADLIQVPAPLPLAVQVE